MFVRRPNAPITGERHQITPPLPLHQVKADNFIHQCGEG